jgi:hypothetical protein
MEKILEYNGIEWLVGYDWDDDARTNMEIHTIKVGNSPDLYEHILAETVLALFKMLEDSFKDY